MIIFIVVSLAVVARLSILLGARQWSAGAQSRFEETKDVSPAPLGGLGAFPLPPSL